MFQGMATLMDLAPMVDMVEDLVIATTIEAMDMIMDMVKDMVAPVMEALVMVMATDIKEVAMETTMVTIVVAMVTVMVNKVEAMEANTMATATATMQAIRVVNKDILHCPYLMKHNLVVLGYGNSYGSHHNGGYDGASGYGHKNQHDRHDNGYGEEYGSYGRGSSGHGNG